MNTLKQVIHYPDTNSVEATWVERLTEKEYYTGEDGEGCVLEAGDEIVIKCHSYADVQMQMFRDDVAELGGDITEHEELIALVESNIKPVEPAPLPILSCSPWQIRKKLNKEGLREAVETYVASEQATQDERDAWEFATEFREDNPLMVNAAAILGITDLHVFIADAQTL